MTTPNSPDATLQHFVSTEPFDPKVASKIAPELERYFLASQWKLMWWKLKWHRLAVFSGLFLLVLYGTTLISEFLAPYDTHTRDIGHIYAPPQSVHLFNDGEFIGPFVYGMDYKLNMVNLKREYTDNPNKIQRLRFFCQGDEYYFWGIITSRLHLVCPAEGGTLFLLGTDRLGRDVLSRIIYGSRISLTIGLVGITLSFFMGMIVGGIAGYFGGLIDTIIQRIIEIIQSFPQIPLWMALSAIMPLTWSPLVIYLAITIILAMLEWTSLARAVRSKLFSLREEEFCTAAKLMGAKPSRIIGRHLLPGFMSYLIAAATLSIPAMILGETALSFLGIGLRAPITSWGVLLNEAQNINIVVLYPWLMLPVVPVILTILAFSLFGDGLRDAADPYK